MDMYPRVWAWENLELAYRQARRGKRGAAPAADFERRLEDNLVGLQDELREETYRPGAYHSFYIHEPKRRLISAAPFRDRVVHHALCNIIEPLFERRFVHDSYANRRDKLYLRLCREWEWLTSGQYEHAARMIAEIGRLLGGWIKATTA